MISAVYNKVIQLYICVYISIHAVFFIFFSIMIYHRTLPLAPCAIKYDFIVYLSYIYTILPLLIPNSHFFPLDNYYWAKKMWVEHWGEYSTELSQMIVIMRGLSFIETGLVRWYWSYDTSRSSSHFRPPGALKWWLRYMVPLTPYPKPQD